MIVSAAVWRAVSVPAIVLVLPAATHAAATIEINEAESHVCLGSVASFRGRVTPAGPRAIGVEDPVSMMSAEVPLAPDGTFSYSTPRPVEREALYAFRFVVSDGAAQRGAYYVVSGTPCDLIRARTHIAAPWVDVELGIQGNSLDDTSAALACKYRPTVVAPSDPSWRDFYVESLMETSDEWLRRFGNDLKSPATIVAVGVTCLLSSGTLCLGAIAMTAVKTSIWTDVEYVIDRALPEELSQEDREDIKKWARIGTTTLTTLTVLDAKGGLDDAVDFVAPWTETAWELRPKVLNIERVLDGSIRSFTIRVTGPNGDVVAFQLQKVDPALLERFAPADNDYLDVRLTDSAGVSLLYHCISGEFRGHVYGMPDATQKNYFMLRDTNGKIARVPTGGVSRVDREIISVAEVTGLTLTLDKGKNHQLREGGIFTVYREFDDVFRVSKIKHPVASVQLIKVEEDRSVALVLACFGNETIRVGDRCW